jgi:hypothetical protein
VQRDWLNQFYILLMTAGTLANGNDERPEAAVVDRRLIAVLHCDTLCLDE